MKFILTILFALAARILHAQTDSVKYTPDFLFKDGIYITIGDLKKNRPTLTPENFMIYNSDTSYQSMKKKNALGKWKKVYYPDSSGAIKEKSLGNLFGYSSNNIIYMFNNYQVYRVFKVGIISYGFQVGDLSRGIDINMTPQGSYVPSYVYNNLVFGHYVRAQEYLMDFKTGKVYEYSRKYFEILLKNADLELYAEYSKLSNSKKKKMMFIYLNKVNEKHPIYFKN